MPIFGGLSKVWGKCQSSFSGKGLLSLPCSSEEAFKFKHILAIAPVEQPHMFLVGLGLASDLSNGIISLAEYPTIAIAKIAIATATSVAALLFEPLVLFALDSAISRSMYSSSSARPIFLLVLFFEGAIYLWSPSVGRKKRWAGQGQSEARSSKNHLSGTSTTSTYYLVPYSIVQYMMCGVLSTSLYYKLLYFLTG